jgi:hypothetical protein
VNGFNASYVDPFHARLLFDQLSDFPDPASRKALFEVLGLRYLVLHADPDPRSFRLHGQYRARSRLERVLQAPPSWIRPVWSGGGSTVAELVEPPDGTVARALRRFGPGRMLRGRAIEFEIRRVDTQGAPVGAPDDWSAVMHLNGAELTRVPLDAAFAAHRVDLPTQAIRKGSNEIDWALVGAADGAIAAGDLENPAAGPDRPQLALRRVTVAPVR